MIKPLNVIVDVIGRIDSWLRMTRWEWDWDWEHDDWIQLIGHWLIWWLNIHWCSTSNSKFKFSCTYFFFFPSVFSLFLFFVRFFLDWIAMATRTDIEWIVDDNTLTVQYGTWLNIISYLFFEFSSSWWPLPVNVRMREQHFCFAFREGEDCNFRFRFINSTQSCTDCARREVQTEHLLLSIGLYCIFCNYQTLFKYHNQ